MSSTPPIFESKDSELAAADERFVSLLVANQPRVYRFLVTLVPQRQDVEDLFQQTCLTLWQSRAKFDASAGEFASWACGIAHNHVRNFRRRESTRRTLLSEEVAELLVATREQHASFLDDCHRALHRCMAGLTTHQRSVLEDCYGSEGGGGIKLAAESSGRSANALYKVVRHIRGILHECIQRTVLEGGAR
ncbi:sigma-70 family RNA polymerase sigma factor [Verrucomicrobium sp. BvORR106]|uniref:sigma-70 family RNA polymerase sigma factor n=1 Tax=Verrucomicrobium sp. BvORR106 TaxID=1403819 RepID=UPI00056DC29D|nr:sigma-70 family RNA polymerase sigma factor [Verrucomicrobium sp. BvORR106]